MGKGKKIGRIDITWKTTLPAFCFKFISEGKLSDWYCKISNLKWVFMLLLQMNKTETWLRKICISVCLNMLLTSKIKKATLNVRECAFSFHLKRRTGVSGHLHFNDRRRTKIAQGLCSWIWFSPLHHLLTFVYHFALLSCTSTHPSEAARVGEISIYFGVECWVSTSFY